MKTLRYITMMFAVALLATSCDDWLDVRGENISKEDDQFENYKGFRDALTGCYIAMADADAYGKRLTMTDIEYLADLWYVEDGHKTYAPEKYYLSNHDYANDYSRPEIKAAYAKLFNVVASANVLLKNIESKGDNIIDNATRKVIEGEAYAIRAYCQLDILRLFGQLPKGGTKQVNLPYSYTTNIDERPAYYSYSEYVELLKKDIEKAESLLKDNDPIFSMTYTELNNPSDAEDDFLYYRQSRLNYWAVRALKARVYLYIGDKAKAYNEAMAVINAQIKGKSVVSLSSKSDYENKKYSTPSECLMQLYNVDLLDYSIDLIGGDPERNVNTDRQLYLTSSNFEKKLFAGANTTSDVRYLNLWERTTKSSTGSKYPTIKKYFKVTTMPLLRLSEMYLIAMETATNLAEANSLYKTFMAARNVNITTDIESEVDLLDKVINEYRLDFYAEGQMFYCYKRLAVKSMLFSYENMGEEQYIIPLPSSEFNPAGK